MTEFSEPIRLPLFPLHAVLLPGVALPLHIFEQRYRLMVARCMQRGDPFGVVLIRAGGEVGGPVPQLAPVGTTARIRRASRYPDGRLDIVTLGGRRFRIDAVRAAEAPYLLGDVRILEEPLGGGDAARLADRVGSLFLRYLGLLEPSLEAQDTPEIEIEIEFDGDELDHEGDDDPVPLRLPGDHDLPGFPDTEQLLDTAALDDDQRRQLLMAAARRLTSTSAPTELSYLISGLVQVHLASRQELLEAPDTVGRLRQLDALLRREMQLLSAHLRPLVLEPRVSALRRN